MDRYMWFTLASVFIFLEIGHPGLLYFLAIAVGCLGAFVASWLEYSFDIQYGVFFLVSLSCIGIVYRFVKNTVIHNTKSHRSNTDLLIGKTVTVVAIQSCKVGHGLVGGETWLIKMQSEDTLEMGAKLLITGVQGCHLQVQKLS